MVVGKLSAKIIGNSIVQLYDGLTLARSMTDRPSSADRQGQGKVVLVTQHYAPFPSTTSGYMTDIAKELAQTRRVLVISSSPDSATKLLTPGEPEVIEIKSWWPKKSALVSRSFAAVLFSIQVFFAVLKHARREDVLLCVTTPFTLPYTVALAARLRRAASALIIYDLYPDTLVMAGFLGASSTLTRWLRSANAVMFRRLDAIVIIGRDMRVKLLDYPKMTAAKLNLIPNWATLPVRYRELDPENPYRRRCEGRFVVAMSGNAGFTHDPESVFEAARLLQDNRDIRFLLSGEGVGWAKLNAMQAASPLPNVTLIERVAEIRTGEFPFRRRRLDRSLPQAQHRGFGTEPHLQFARRRATDHHLFGSGRRSCNSDTGGKYRLGFSAGGSTRRWPRLSLPRHPPAPRPPKKDNGRQ